MLYDCIMSLLDIRDLRIAFGQSEAVRGISFQLDEGEVLGLVGESGSGKSATSLAILRLLGPAARVSGQILWRDKVDGSNAPGPRTDEMVDLLRQSPTQLQQIRGREIAMIFQEPMTALNPVMTVGRQVAECAEAHARSPAATETIRISSPEASVSAF